MGASESTLRSAAYLLVQDRREEVDESTLRYLKTPEFRKFFKDNMDRIKKRACRIYGLELKEAILDKNVTRANALVSEIDDHCSYIVIEIMDAVDLMVSTGKSEYLELISKISDFIDLTTLNNAIKSGRTAMYNEIVVFNEIEVPSVHRNGKIYDASVKDFMETILTAVVEVVKHPNSAEAETILIDVLEYVKNRSKLSERNYNNMVQKISTNVRDGLLNEKYAMLELDTVSREKQRKVYNLKLERIFDHYPTIGFLEQFY